MASCWVSVEPPSMPLPPVTSRMSARATADRIDAEMIVEPPILDRHERLRQTGRQVAEPDGGAAGVAAVGDERAVVGEDGDVRRALGHRELVDRRQLARVVGHERSHRDRRPKRRARRPNRRSRPSQERRLFPARFERGADLQKLLLFRRPPGGRSAGSARRSSPPLPPRQLRRGSIRSRVFLPPRPNIADPARGVSGDGASGETRPAGSRSVRPAV